MKKKINLNLTSEQKLVLFEDGTGDPNFVSSGQSANILQIVHTLY